MPLTEHGIPREEWLRRFRARIGERGRTGDDGELPFDEKTLDMVVEAESECLLRDGSWLFEGPEEAADESMSYWEE